MGWTVLRLRGNGIREQQCNVSDERVGGGRSHKVMGVIKGRMNGRERESGLYQY